MASEPIHVDLSDLQPGAHAKVTAAADITHGQRRRVERALEGIEDALRVDAFHLAAIAHLVPHWTVKDVDGKTLPQPAALKAEDLERTPARVVARVLRAVQGEWRKLIAPEAAEDPNATPASSSASSSPA